MNKQPNQDPYAKANRIHRSSASAKEVLTHDLACKLAIMVGQFPETNVAVTWGNVMQQAKLRFGCGFSRALLSQKSWDGRKLIAEAFKDAKAIQRRLALETGSQYARRLNEEDRHDKDAADEQRS